MMMIIKMIMDTKEKELFFHMSKGNKRGGMEEGREEGREGGKKK